jgi:pimeloyl-ACP methyl ester carboxylesterase
MQPPSSRNGAGWPDPDSTLPSPLEALGVLASTDVMIGDDISHVEMFTAGGLLSLLWHQPTTGVAATSAAIVACGGAMGGLLGPGRGLYHQLGEMWSARGVPMIRVSYRRPNDMDACCLDLAAAVQMVATAGAERVVLMGHSFGGAVAVRVGVVLPEVVTGVATFATQSAGCEVASGLAGRPLLLFHGDRDEILPAQSSDIVRLMAGSGEVVTLVGDGHLLAASHDVMIERLEQWLPEVLGLR